MLCWLQYILIYSQSNIRHLIRHWRWTNSSSSYDVTKNTQFGNYHIGEQNIWFITDTTWYIFISQDNDLWTMKYNSVLGWTSIITKSNLLLRIPRKPEEVKVKMCAAVVAPSGTAHLLHSNDNTLKQNSNHAPWSHEIFNNEQVRL
jgi:hypothetical protein